MKSEVEDVMESHMPKPDKPLFSQLGQFCNFCFKKSEITFDMASLSLSISARFLWRLHNEWNQLMHSTFWQLIHYYTTLHYITLHQNYYNHMLSCLLSFSLVGSLWLPGFPVLKCHRCYRSFWFCSCFASKNYKIVTPAYILCSMSRFTCDMFTCDMFTCSM